ncbi:MAG: hypothetical protein KKB13_19735, partial [Chloroflexi bacterium]|nr:hypothetical protein [Chloroflexota bacterium]
MPAIQVSTTLVLECQPATMDCPASSWTLRRVGPDAAARIHLTWAEAASLRAALSDSMFCQFQSDRLLRYGHFLADLFRVDPATVRPEASLSQAVDEALTHAELGQLGAAGPGAVDVTSSVLRVWYGLAPQDRARATAEQFGEFCQVDPDQVPTLVTAARSNFRRSRWGESLLAYVIRENPQRVMALQLPAGLSKLLYVGGYKPMPVRFLLALSDAELLAMPGLGPAELTELDRELEQQGFTRLRREPPPGIWVDALELPPRVRNSLFRHGIS